MPVGVVKKTKYATCPCTVAFVVAVLRVRNVHVGQVVLGSQECGFWVVSGEGGGGGSDMKGFALHFSVVDIFTPFPLSLCVCGLSVVVCFWQDRTSASRLLHAHRDRSMCTVAIRVQLKFASPIQGILCAPPPVHDGGREHDFPVSGTVSRALCHAIATREHPFKITGDAWAIGCAVQRADRRWRDP